MRSHSRAPGFSLRAFTSGIAFALLASTVTTLPPPIAAADPIDVPTVAADPTTAARYAATSGEPVQVTSATSENEELFANPDGTMTYRQHVQPVRVRQGGDWVPVDLELERKADGTVVPKAAPVEMEFSGGGGDRPVGKVVSGEHEIGFSWPTPLPAPVLDGTTLTYPAVLPDVDLKVEVGLKGFSQVLVVKTAEAADNPALRRIEFPSHTENVSLHENQGALAAKNAEGATVFTGDATRMWDSSGQQEGERIAGPGPGDRTATMDVEVTSDAVAVTPDQSFLDDRATTYPVHIDPTYYCTSCGKAHHVVVESPWPDAKNFDVTSGRLNDLKVGKVNGAEMQSPNGEAGTARSYVQMNTQAIIGKHIESATLRTKVTHSYSCSPGNASVWLTEWVDANTTWRNQTAWTRKLSEANRANHPAVCPSDGTMDFDVASAVRDASAGGWGITTFAIVASNENEQDKSWRRLDLNPYLEVKYNSYPNPPTDLGMEGLGPDGDQAIPCRVGADRAYVFNHTPRLRARVSDPDGGILDTAFKLFKGPQGAFTAEYPEFYASDIPSGQFGEARVPTGLITQDGVYTWRAWAGDRQFHTWSQDCEFEVDSVKPSTPLITSTDYPQDGDHGSVGRTGQFTFKVNGNTGPGGSMDVKEYTWSLNGGEGVVYTQPVTTADGTTSVAVTPTQPGPNTLYAYAVDRAGNRSAAIAEYRFNVTLPQPPLAEWTFTQDSGATVPDTGALNRPLTAIGGARFGTGYSGNALLLNGTDASAQSVTSIVDTSKAFSATAWVRLDRTNGFYTVLSQDGDRVSPFYLQYDPQVNRWRISASEGDHDLPNTVAVNSLAAPKAGAWNHLAITYEPNSRVTKLYVDGKLQGSAQMTFWQAKGSFVVGGARWSGKRDNHFPGAVDHVQLWDRMLGDDDVAASANKYVLRARYSLDERTGTTTRDEVSGGVGTLSGGVAWGGDTRTAASSQRKWLTYDNTSTGRVTAPRPEQFRTDRSYTASVWVRHSGVDEPSRAGLSTGDDRYSPFLLGYRGESGKWGFLVSGSATVDGGWFALSDNPAEEGRWTHLVATYNAVTGRIGLYVDGVMQKTYQDTPDGSGVHSRDSTGSLIIGSATWHGLVSDTWKGDVDDARVYSGVLSDEDVDLLYNESFHY
ncbi:LamG-like jellyroll fold domain-containing protein [Actinosynnema pretiosum]|uniref:LamG-like jellyroll fold domain-containing protein n=1 Tax=Actinosynnema pretiosum TaxID=42197 RepID=A0A290ZAF8_9PSEU|nr:LamG-like jellyroll fold domain-containing protein [Actinosynnema pretiosum]ATE55974.1 hypothetical protein CNX65_24080 [Actinosynnema pretiosum]